MSNGILDSDQSRELHELLGSLYEEKLAKKVLEEESAEPEQTISESNIEEPTGVEKYVNTTRDHISKRNTNRLYEKNDLLAGPESVTSSQLQKSNQELWNRVQTALASLGGGGLGDQDVLDLIKRNPSYNFYTDSDYERIANSLQTNFVHRQGDSMYGTLHLNQFNGNSGAPLMQIDGPEEDSADINFFVQQAGYNDSTNVNLRLHGNSSTHRLNFRAGPNNNSNLGDVFSIKGDGNIEISPTTKTDNYSQWDNHDVHMQFYGTNSKIEMYHGYIASDIIRSSDSQLRLFNDYGSLKAKFGNSLTELWNEQVRVHGALYVDDSGTIGDDLTVGGNISGSGDIDITGDLTCDDLEASNGQIGFLRVGQPGVPNSGTLIVEGPATINGDIDGVGSIEADSANLAEINLSKATTDGSDPFFTFYEENGTHTLGVGWDLALLSKAGDDIDKMAIVTSENKILRFGYQNQSGFYEYPISIGTGDVSSPDLERQRATRVRYLAEPAASGDAVPLGYLTNSYTSRLQPSQIGDSAQRTVVQSGFSTPLDSTDSSGGVGTLFINTSGIRPKLQFWKDSQWQDLRSKFDSNEVLSIIDNLRYTTADHDSDTLAQVDSAYVQARVTFPPDLVGLDSDAVINLIDSDYINIRVDVTNPFDQTLNTTDIVTFDQVYANLDGAVEFKANNRSGGTILKGQPVYIDGVDGNKPTVALADANDPNKMPAFGLALEDANDNADIIVVTFGSLKDVDTSTYDLGDTLYIGTTPGTLVTTPPAGANSLIQNIGRVIRSHESAGSIKVGGAGRSNATPNLDAGYIFYGNDSNRSEEMLLTSVVDSNYVQTRIDASQLDFSGVPTSDPLTAGLVWRDSDNGNVLKVSVG